MTTEFTVAVLIKVTLALSLALAIVLRRRTAAVRVVCAVGMCTAVMVADVAPLRAVKAVVPISTKQPTLSQRAQLAPSTASSSASQEPSIPLKTNGRPSSLANLVMEIPKPVANGAGTVPAAESGIEEAQRNGDSAVGPPKIDGAAPQFDVATVKVNRSGGRGGPPRVVPATGQVTITNATVASVIQDAYGVQLPSNIINMPDWARTLRIDVVAKAAAPAPVATLQRMLQPLLAEYFKLAVHREMREMDVFALVLTNPGRPGPKLQKIDSACENVVGTTMGFARPSDGPDLRQVCGVFPNTTAGEIIAHGIDLAGLATELAPSQRRPVVDRTGLTGRYDVNLKWTPEAFTTAALAQRPGSTPPPGVDPSGPQLPTALQDQLGLKFESTRAPIEVLVIDRAEPLTTAD